MRVIVSPLGIKFQTPKSKPDVDVGVGVNSVSAVLSDNQIIMTH